MKKVSIVLCSFILSCSTVASARQQHFDISLEQRVAFQKALDEVYWRHMIWPESNQQPKPSLDAVVPYKAIQMKTEEYLRKSNALAHIWQHPITADQMQAEMDRMASETNDSVLLRELWAALENDPYLIAECLARPLLVEQLTQHFPDFEEWWTREHSAVRMLTTMPAHHYKLPQITQSTESVANSWKGTNTNGAPSGRISFTAVSTGAQLIIWGGSDKQSDFTNTGGIYTPATNSWSSITKNGAPSARLAHTSVWTGTEMIVWGGFSNVSLKTGGRYNPITNSWSETTRNSAPSARSIHTAVWTGTEMIIWGGFGISHLRTGGRYNPSTDSWRATKTTGAPSPRIRHTAVWTGTEMIVWGGFKRTSNGVITFDTGGRYNPSTNSWKATPKAGAPSKRFQHTAVWTGTEMIIWGGAAFGETAQATGARYKPSSNSWSATTTSRAPAARALHTAVWTGTEMIIWGGSANSNLKTGGRYNPSKNSWNPTTLTGAPAARFVHAAVWTGDQMIIWGGQNSAQKFLKTGGRYTP